MTPRPQRRWSLAARWSLTFVALLLVSIAVALALDRLIPERPVAIAALTLLAMIPVAIVVVRANLKPLLAIFRALEGTVASYRDRDFAFGLHWPRNDEVGDLVAAHNALGDVLRHERLELTQRELLLDTMVQNTPVAMLLVTERRTIAFANIAARQLLNEGRRLEGESFDELLRRASTSLAEAVGRADDGLFTVAGSGDGDEADGDTYHLARRNYTLNGRSYELLLLRHLTTELRRQEVQTWKKVIRVISHELNNSLAPIASLANSGTELVRRQQIARLPEILSTIADRTRHLETFINGYARFAKLPFPRKTSNDWPAFIASLQSQIGFAVRGDIPDDRASFDVGQLEQALLNLLKNAHESGSPAERIELAVRRIAGGFAIEVRDRGPGMSDAVMANALVPFYSTKRHGTGLGLALAREIVDAHGGRIAIANREGGGLAVTLFLPQ